MVNGWDGGNNRKGDPERLVLKSNHQGENIREGPPKDHRQRDEGKCVPSDVLCLHVRCRRNHWKPSSLDVLTVWREDNAKLQLKKV